MFLKKEKLNYYLSMMVYKKTGGGAYSRTTGRWSVQAYKVVANLVSGREYRHNEEHMAGFCCYQYGVSVQV